MCPACWRDVREFTAPLCVACGAPVAQSSRAGSPRTDCPLCRLEPLAGVTRAAALGPYEGRLRDIVHALKFGRNPTLAARLGARLAVAHADLLVGMDAVVPVPLHAGRRRRRGFNQAHEIARHLGLRVIPALRRVRRTEAQAGLDAAARRRNVRDAFERARAVAAWDRAAGMAPFGDRAGGVAGRRVVLVDDVWTTGATLSACAGVLLEMGVREVRALAVARTLPVTGAAAVANAPPGARVTARGDARWPR